MQRPREAVVLRWVAPLLASVWVISCGSPTPTSSHRVSDRVSDNQSPPAPPPALPLAMIAHLRVDTNRDGVLDDLDEPFKAVWTAEHGAIMLANVDDDDADGVRDGDDDEIDGELDNDDLTPLRVRRVAGLQEQHRVVLRVTPQQAAARLRIFHDEAQRLVHAPGDGSVELDLRELDEDLWLQVEAIEPRDGRWNGHAQVHLDILDANGLVSSDTVALRCAPVIFPDNTQKGEKLYVMRITAAQNAPNRPLIDALNALVTDMEIVAVDEYRYGADRWLQDSMQTGYQQRPPAFHDNSRAIMLTHLQTTRFGGRYSLQPLLTANLLGANLGYVAPGGRETSLNYGGNIEVAPPHQDHPLGRIVIGGGDLGTLLGHRYDDHITPRQLAFIEAQEVQGVPIEVSTEWLAVGHVDEIIMFVDAGEAPSSHGFKVVIASPDLAKQPLEALAAAGLGSRIVFWQRESETTVDEILSDLALMRLNDSAQARIDEVRLVLTEALALHPRDFIEVPVLYESFDYDGLDFAAALNPGIQNMVVGNGLLLIPDPEGPTSQTPDERGAAIDVWREQTTAALAPLGHRIAFVDVFDSYHLLMGEAHCGTNIEQRPYTTPWWNATPPGVQP